MLSLTGSKLKSESFPSTYGEALRQAAVSTQAAIQDGCKLIEVEFPPVSLASVAGDGEGANEMTYSMQYLRQFCRPFQQGAATTREMQVAMSGAGKNPAAGSWDVNPVFDVTKFQLDYLTTPSGLLDIGIDFNKVDVASRCKPSDQLYIIAYPHFNVNELIAVQELHSKIAAAGGQPIVVFNGELDRIRSGYYPALFFPKLGRLAKTFLPDFEAAYYIHNFKGTKGGALFRAYPGPWQVYRRLPNMEMVRVQSQDSMPTLKQVALEILPMA
eukprot:jgi/Astpho2/8847/Aster-05482